MPVLTSCCGCWQLRLGTYISCGYSLICSLIAVSLSAYGIHNYLHNGYNLLSNETALSMELSMEHRVLYIANCIDIGLYAVLLVSSVLVIVGVKELERRLFIPYLVTMGMLVVLQILVCLLSVVAFIMQPEMGGFIEMALAFIFLVIDMLCWLCVLSYYQELREGRAQIRANYTIRVPEIGQFDKSDIVIDTSQTSEGPPAYTTLYPGP